MASRQVGIQRVDCAPSERLTREIESQIHTLITRKGMVTAIKFVRDATGWELKKSKEYVDWMVASGTLFPTSTSDTGCVTTNAASINLEAESKSLERERIQNLVFKLRRMPGDSDRVVSETQAKLESLGEVALPYLRERVLSESFTTHESMLVDSHVCATRVLGKLSHPDALDTLAQIIQRGLSKSVKCPDDRLLRVAAEGLNHHLNQHVSDAGERYREAVHQVISYFSTPGHPDGMKDFSDSVVALESLGADEAAVRLAIVGLSSTKPARRYSMARVVEQMHIKSPQAEMLLKQNWLEEIDPYVRSCIGKALTRCSPEVSNLVRWVTADGPRLWLETRGKQATGDSVNDLIKALEETKYWPINPADVNLVVAGPQLKRFLELEGKSDDELIRVLSDLASRAGSWSDRDRATTRDIGQLLCNRGGMELMKHALDVGVGRTPGQRTIDQMWDGIGSWRG